MNVFLKADLKKLGFCAALFAVLYVLLEMESSGILGTEPRPYHHQHHPGDEPLI